jgi:hypothetical protein
LRKLGNSGFKTLELVITIAFNIFLAKLPHVITDIPRMPIRLPRSNHTLNQNKEQNNNRIA